MATRVRYMVGAQAPSALRGTLGRFVERAEHASLAIRGRSTTAGRVTLLGAIAILCVACGTHHGATEHDDDIIPECRDYAQAFDACWKRRDGETVTPMRARDDTERARLKSLCAINLTRLHEACK